MARYRHLTITHRPDVKRQEKFVGNFWKVYREHIAPWAVATNRERPIAYWQHVAVAQYILDSCVPGCADWQIPANEKGSEHYPYSALYLLLEDLAYGNSNIGFSRMPQQHPPEKITIVQDPPPRSFIVHYALTLLG